MSSGATVGECAFRHDNQCVFFAIRQIAPLEYNGITRLFWTGFGWIDASVRGRVWPTWWLMEFHIIVHINIKNYKLGQLFWLTENLISGISLTQFGNWCNREQRRFLRGRLYSMTSEHVIDNPYNIKPVINIEKSGNGCCVCQCLWLTEIPRNVSVYRSHIATTNLVCSFPT